jgi:DNA-binding winged helix-turn-helix (wHTH) protein/tetratricopeptide (TPR) repeat protein
MGVLFAAQDGMATRSLAPQCVKFATFTFDGANACLRRGDQQLQLSPKDCALLDYFIRNRERTIAHAELLQAVWPSVAVGPDVLKVRVRRLRRLLDDDAGAPRYIANVHGEGYRFIALPEEAAACRREPTRGLLVGRSAELQQLRAAFQRAQHGERQLVLLRGEPGIGKTALIEEFCAELDAPAQSERVWLGRGQCVELFGQGEAYLPVMEALQRIGKSSAAPELKAVLRRCAPTWLYHLGELIDAEESNRLRELAAGRAPERMLRELAEALEATALIGSPPVVVLVLEDLHWADASTINLLSLLSRRREPARLLVVGSYRPSDAPANVHQLPLALSELLGHGLATQITLHPLSERDVMEYCATRFEGAEIPTALAPALWRRTGGNPLFLHSIVQLLCARGLLQHVSGQYVFEPEWEDALSEIPADIRELLSGQRARLREIERAVLESASIVGTHFSAASVAAALDVTQESVEALCSRLAEDERFVRRAGVEEWPDGTTTERFEFKHALYRDLWREHIGEDRRVEWQRRIGLRRELGYSSTTIGIAAELALRFQDARDYLRAGSYCKLAAEHALQRGAYAEATAHVSTGFELQARASGDDAQQLELSLHVVHSTVLSFTAGFAAAETEAALQRALTLSDRLGNAPARVAAMRGLHKVMFSRGKRRETRLLAEQLLELSERGSNPTAQAMARGVLAHVMVVQGEYEASLRTALQALEQYRAHPNPALVSISGYDPEVMSLTYAATAQQMLGFPDRAARYTHEMLETLERVTHPFILGSAHWAAAWLYNERREPLKAKEHGERSYAIALEQGLPELLPIAEANLGCTAIVEGNALRAATHLEHALVTMRPAGSETYRPWVLALVADAYRSLGEWQRAAAAVDEAGAIGAAHGGIAYDAELERIRGQLVLDSAETSQGRTIPPAAVASAERHFQRALEMARAFQARWWELRSSLALGSLWRRVGEDRAAQNLVSQTYNLFSEGLELRELQAARKFLGITRGE